jgi:hypothetical protein
MKKSLSVAAVAGLLIVASLAVARAQKELSKDHVTHVSASKATFKPMERSGGAVSSAVLYGDPDKGPHATFTKFKPGYDAGTHYHTNDVRIVVIKGAYLYKPGRVLISSRRSQALERRRQDRRRAVLSGRPG